jgi:hypothetical protein
MADVRDDADDLVTALTRKGAVRRLEIGLGVR